MTKTLKQWITLIGTALLGNHSTAANLSTEPIRSNDSFLSKLSPVSQSNAIHTNTRSNSYGTFSFSQESYTVNEGSSEAILIIERTDCGPKTLWFDIPISAITTPVIGDDNSLGDDKTIPSRTTATEGEDYDYQSEWDGRIFWGTGDCSSRASSVSIYEDSLVEGNETILFRIGRDNLNSNANFLQREAILTILDNDHSVIDFSQNNYHVNEDEPVATITINRTDCTEKFFSPMSVYYRIYQEEHPYTTAQLGSDYQVASDYGTLFWKEGEGCVPKSFEIAIIDDNQSEGDEFVNFEFNVPTSDTTYQAELIIKDNDNSSGLGVLSFSQENYTYWEGETEINEAKIVVERRGCTPNSPPISVLYFSHDGSAIQGEDYHAVSGMLNWNENGDCALKGFSLPVIDDEVVEQNETVHLTLRALQNDLEIVQPDAILTITDNDGSRIGFSQPNYPVPETEPFVPITIERTDCQTGFLPPVTVWYYNAYFNGTFWADSDSDEDYHDINAAQLSWEENDCQPQTLKVFLNDDSNVENNESIFLKLTGAIGATLDQAQAEVTIVDNDLPILGFYQENYRVDEGSAEKTIYIEYGNSYMRDGKAYTNVSIISQDGTATSGEDYEAINGLLKKSSFTVFITDDTEIEENETIHLKLTTSSSDVELDQSDAVLTIVDNDSSTIGYSQENYYVNENAGLAKITVERTCLQNPAQPASVRYRADSDSGTATASGVDYQYRYGQLSWEANNCDPLTFEVSITHDAVTEENDETIWLNLYDPMGATLKREEAVLTIIDSESPLIDNEPEPEPEPGHPGVFSFSETDYQIDEDKGLATIEINRTQCEPNSPIASVFVATQNGSALLEEDYDAISTHLTWKVGQCEPLEFEISITDDVRIEPNETIQVILIKPTAGATLNQSSSVVTIIDNDSSVIGFSNSNYSVENTNDFASITVNHDCLENVSPPISVQYKAGQYEGQLKWKENECIPLTFEVPITDDSEMKADNTMTLTLSHPSGATLSHRDAVLTVIDEDLRKSTNQVPTRIGFSQQNYWVKEAKGSETADIPVPFIIIDDDWYDSFSASIEVQRINCNPDTPVVQIPEPIHNGTATFEQDYIVRAHGWWFRGECVPKPIWIPIVNDSEVEGDEIVYLKLSNPSDSKRVFQSTAVLTIIDDDSTVVPTTANLSLNQTRYTALEPLRLNITLDGHGMMDLYIAVVLPDDQFMTLGYPQRWSYLNTPQVYLSDVKIAGKAVYPILDINLPTGLSLGNYKVCAVLTRPNTMEVLNSDNWVNWHCLELEIY